MITDAPPTGRLKLADFNRSDKLDDLPVPADDRLHRLALQIDQALAGGELRPVAQACSAFIAVAANFYGVSAPKVRVLAARPRLVYEFGSAELFGDYHILKKTIRVWMRTAIRKQVTSFGTFLSTLCHEFCHHLDYEYFGFSDSFHTRGFYERVAALYHHARGTPRKRLYWLPAPGDRWRIDWLRTRQGG